MQFLIGLVQAVWTPNDDEWLDRIGQPPLPEVLRGMMSSIREPFELYGSDHPFMQEIGMAKPTSKPIGVMIIGSPGDNTILKNTDFFNKREQVSGCLCSSCTAAALYTFQSMAPIGGKGLRSSIHGTDPLVVVLIGRNLWETVCLNVLIKENLGRSGETSGIFPWMNGYTEEVDRSDYDPRMVYWLTVRRVLLHPPRVGRCALCGAEEQVFDGFDESPAGMKCNGWMHPLSPFIKKKDTVSPVKMTRDIGHMDGWTSILYNGNSTIIQPDNVRQLEPYRFEVGHLMGSESIRAWISGFENNQAVALAWISIYEPVLLNYDDDQKKRIISIIRRSSVIAVKASKDLKKAVIKLYELDRQSSRGDPSDALNNYWTACDDAFRSLFEHMLDHETDKLLAEWVVSLRTIAFRVFDDNASAVPLDSYGDAADARIYLRKCLSDKSMQKELNKI